MYRFYSKNDSKKETIGTNKASTIKLATEIFAETKNLKVEVFNRLFSVEAYERTKKNS